MARVSKKSCCIPKITRARFFGVGGRLVMREEEGGLTRELRRWLEYMVGWLSYACMLDVQDAAVEGRCLLEEVRLNALNAQSSKKLPYNLLKNQLQNLIEQKRGKIKTILNVVEFHNWTWNDALLPRRTSCHRKEA